MNKAISNARPAVTAVVGVRRIGAFASRTGVEYRADVITTGGFIHRNAMLAVEHGETPEEVAARQYWPEWAGEHA